MSTVKRILPCYTADVSGACSALYELGGMVVMHDPSGCNSTYNTHDETRWYDNDSLIYISGLTEREAIFGDDRKFIRDVVDAAEQLKPAFIALVSAPIPWMNGTDFQAIVRILQKETGLPVFFVKTCGMHDYVIGAGEALLQIAKTFVRFAEKQPHTLNLLGLTPLDFAAKGSAESLKQVCEEHGWQILSTWAMGDTLDNLKKAGSAEMNLVVSSVGLAAAEYLENTCGIPYVTGAPIGLFADAVFEALDAGTTTVPYLNRQPETNDLLLIGEPVVMGSLAAAITMKYGIGTRVLSPLERSEGLLRTSDLAVRSEAEQETILKSVPNLIADPLYHYICPDTVKLYELPHLAFSGRCFRKNFVNLFEMNL